MENFRRRLKNILLVVLLLLSSVVHKSSGLPMFAKDVLDTKAERQVSLFLLFRLSSFHYVFLTKNRFGVLLCPSFASVAISICQRSGVSDITVLHPAFISL